MIELIFGYLAGLLTLLNPCVLPILPIILVSALRQDRLGPVALAAGMSLTFVVLGVGVAALGPAFGIDDLIVSRTAALVMVLFGLILLVPRFNAAFAGGASLVSAQAGSKLDSLDQSGLAGQFIAGLLLGAVWSPCIGPTIGGAISLASQGQHLVWATAIMASFALGVSTIILALAYGAREAIVKRQAALRGLAERARPIMGVALVTIGLAIFFGLHHRIDAWLLNILPAWFQDLSVAL
jgi:cytochrome c biogenesis protein CcdA